MSPKLVVVELFNSIQGEGANVGKAATFIRLANCNLNCVFCDTQWDKGVEMTLDEIRTEIEKYNTRLLIWTGGEPTLQLNNEILAAFPDYYHAIETNGTRTVPSLIDYISCSPKVPVSMLLRNFQSVNEFRFPISAGDPIPSIDDLPKADNYFLSPIFNLTEKKEDAFNRQNLTYCLEAIKTDARWRLSVQVHKFLNIE